LKIEVFFSFLDFFTKNRNFITINRTSFYINVVLFFDNLNKRMLEKDEMEEIKKEVKKEFPEDYALQQVHIARKIIAKEAEK